MSLVLIRIFTCVLQSLQFICNKLRQNIKFLTNSKDFYDSKMGQKIPDARLFRFARLLILRKFSYSWVPNSRSATAIYFGWFCKALRSYLAPLRLLESEQRFWNWSMKPLDYRFLGSILKMLIFKCTIGAYGITFVRNFLDFTHFYGIPKTIFCFALRLLCTATAIDFGTFCTPVRLFSRYGY